MPTVTACAIGLMVFGVQTLIWIGLIKLGTRWAKITTTWNRVIWLVVMLFSVWGLARVAGLISLDYGRNAMIGATCFWVFAELLFPLLAIRKWFSATALQTFKIWLTSLLSVVLALALSFFVRRFLLEAFSVPTNAMAPTVIGSSMTGTCSECGETTYFSPNLLETQNGWSSRPAYLICDRFHTTELPVSELRPTEITSRDRILVSKLIKPQRWDVLAFRNPAAPQQNYIKRVVGFPGETLQLKEGGVWIDGAKCEPPALLAGLRYETDPAKFMQRTPLAGTNKIVLGADEYFVLGDNTLNAYDARLWSRGAVGYPSYAVPEDHIIGVVTHIYWPKNRMRILK